LLALPVGRESEQRGKGAVAGGAIDVGGKRDAVPHRHREIAVDDHLVHGA